ncbi:MAG: cation diffusion facilitator family transporter [Acidimicrobiia bacterium]|nr:MAG: cation diffusion facilitator family transporter [Acidimicrobiia bacterium]
MASESKRLILLALTANAFIAVTKFIAAGISGSSAMLAEAIHSAADTGNQLFLLRGEAVSRYKADVTHPFGRGKAMYFWSFMVAVVLFVGGAVLSIINGWQRIQNPDAHEGEGLVFSLVVLAIAAGFEIFLALVPAIKQFNRIRGTKSAWRMIKESKDSALIIVLFEDTAAVTGLVIAATGLILTDITGSAVWDGLASVLIGLVLGAVALVIAREMSALLIGEAASREDRSAIRVAILSIEEVHHVERLLTMQLALHEILVTADVAFDENVDEVAAIERIEISVSEACPEATRIFIEAVRR